MLNSQLVSEMMAAARKAALAAGQVIREQVDEPRHVEEKGPRDLVTETDRLAQDAALEIITARFPDHTILAEEDTSNHTIDESGRWTIPPGLVWMVDPLDGTTNFTTGLPFSCVSIGVAFDGVLTVGAIYDPYRNELFTAAKGQGASVNGLPLPKLAPIPLLRSVVSLDWARAPHVRHRALNSVAALAAHCQTVRALGSAALAQAYVACGRVQLYFNYGLQPWDVAAGALLITEVGGGLVTPEGLRWAPGDSALLAGHPDLLQETLPLVRASVG
jgi:myo-inositol-1(or 4)-monophosphatase